MENTLKEDERIGRMRQEYFAVYGEYANRHKIKLFSANFRPNQKNVWSKITVPLKPTGIN